MANSWSKEDRVHFEKSEVMQELEKGVLDTIRRVDILQKKYAESFLSGALEDSEQLKQNLDEIGQKQPKSQAAHDEASDEVAEDGLGMADGAEDEAYDEGLQNEVVDDLRNLVAAALAEGNIKLAYKIERTIDEILEQDVVCV